MKKMAEVLPFSCALPVASSGHFLHGGNGDRRASGKASGLGKTGSKKRGSMIFGYVVFSDRQTVLRNDMEHGKDAPFCSHLWGQKAVPAVREDS